MAQPPSTLEREVRGIAGHGLLYMFAALASRCIGFVMIPVYTRHMDTADYGVLEMLDLVVQVTAMILAFGLANAAMRYHALASGPEAARRVMSTAQLAAIALSLAGSLLLVALAAPLATHLLDGRPVRLLWFVAGSTLGTGLAGVPLTYLRIQGRARLYVVASLGQLALALTLNIVFVVGLQMGAEGVVLSGLITQLSFGLLLCGLLVAEVGTFFEAPVFMKLARFGAPLLLSAAGTFLLTSGDRYIVKELAGLDEVGLYGLGYKLGFIIQILLVGPFFLVWQPRSYAIEHDPAARTVYARVFTHFFTTLVFGATVLSVLAQDLVRLMTTPEFYDAWRFVPWIAFACVFNGVQVYCRIGMYLRERTGLAGSIMLVTALLSLTAAWFATLAHGAMGAAVVSFASYVVLASAMAIASRRSYAIPYERSRLLKPVAAVAAVALLSALNPLEGVALSILWNACACCAFPALLLALRFYTPEERRWLVHRYAGARARLRARLDG